MQISKYQNAKILLNLPKQWILVKFDELLLDVTRTGTKIPGSDYEKSALYPIVDQGKEFIAGYSNMENPIKGEKIVFGDHTRTLKYIDFDYFHIGADGVKVLENKMPDKVLTKYIYYYLTSIDIPNTGYNRHFKYLKEIIIPVPNIEVQAKLVNLLDQVNNLIIKRQSQIEALDELTKSLFLDMFGDPIVNKNNYLKAKLNDLCLKITDGTHHSPPMVEEGIPYVSAKHLGKGYLDFYSNPAYVSKEEHEKIYSRCNPVKGDVLYIKDGATTGIAGINPYDFEFSMLSSLALIRTDSKILNNFYLVHYLNNERVKDIALSNMSGGAIKRLTIKKIKDFQIMVPPIELQNRFEIKIIEIEKQKEMMKSHLNNLNMLYHSMLQKAFKGELK